MSSGEASDASPSYGYAGPLDCHPGHRVYLGGPLNGEVAHLVRAAPVDYPLSMTVMRGDKRHFYDRDLDGGAHCLYIYRGVI